VAGFDACARGYPFVGCVNAPGEFFVGNALGGQVAACAEYFGVFHGRFSQGKMAALYAILWVCSIYS